MDLTYWTKKDILSFLHSKYDGTLSFQEGRDFSRHLNKGLEGMFDDLKPIITDACWDVATGKKTPQEHARLLYQLYFIFYERKKSFRYGNP